MACCQDGACATPTANIATKIRILITGGSGTVGSAFIREYRDRYQFAVLSRNEQLSAKFSQEFPEVPCYLANVDNREQLFHVYEKVRPNAVIHAAAIKHINLAELQPIQASTVNVTGSLNVIAASQRFDVPVTIGISTDKACNSTSVYGLTKLLMEKCFLEANTPTNCFAVCRFANVAHSNGSVIPLWLAAAAKGEKLKITNPDMARMIFSQADAARLVHAAIRQAQHGGGFILSKLLKQVNILDLAKTISDNYEVIGPRPGEKAHEDLISAAEAPYTELLADGYVRINTCRNTNGTGLNGAYNSQNAPKMTAEELRELVYQTSSAELHV